MPIIINPRALSDEDKKMLAAFFNHKDNSNRGYWEAGKSFSIAGHEFKFTSDIVKRRCNTKKNEGEYRYEFINNSSLLGEGGFGAVYEIEGTLAVGQDSVNFKENGRKGKARVVKIQVHGENNLFATAEKEYHFANKAGHLRVKPIAPLDNTRSYMVMKKLAGKELFDIIFDREGNRLTVKQRSELTQALLNALKEQVIDKKIIHCDIKPENIFVDLSASPISVSIIDFGLSVELDSNHVPRGGTLDYAPLEFLQKHYKHFKLIPTAKYDVFSMGRVIALIWGAEGYDLKSGEKRLEKAYSDDLCTLFSGFRDSVSEADQQLIKTTLTAMLKPVSERLSIEEAIEKFSHLTSENKQVREEHTVSTVSVSSIAPQATKGIKECLKKIQCNIGLLQQEKDTSDVQTGQKIDSFIKGLEERLVNLEDPNEDYPQTVEACQKFIKEQKDELPSSPTVSYILANIALAVATLGTIYLYCMAKYVSTGKANFTFFKEELKEHSQAHKLCVDIDLQLDALTHLNKR